MSTLDPAVTAILDRNTAADSDDEDALINALEEEDDTSLLAFREQRLQQLHSELSRAKEMRNSEYGSYTELKDEKKLMETTTACKFAIVHFMKPDFQRCAFMDQKLEALAPKHFDTRFLSINVENCPFLVTKLKIQVLPCVLCFVNGVSTDRILGFEGIGWKPDTFTLQELEARLLRAGVLLRSKMIDEDEFGNRRNKSLKASESREDDADDDEWD